MAQFGRGKKIGLFKINEIELMPGDEILAVEDNVNWVIRHRQPGDSLKMSFGNQKIKKVFIDKKFQVNREIRVG